MGHSHAKMFCMGMPPCFFMYVYVPHTKQTAKRYFVRYELGIKL